MVIQWFVKNDNQELRKWKHMHILRTILTCVWEKLFAYQSLEVTAMSCYHILTHFWLSVTWVFYWLCSKAFIYVQKNGLGKKTSCIFNFCSWLRPYLMQKCLSADRGAKLTPKYGTLPPSDVRSYYAFMLQSSRLVLGQMGCFLWAPSMNGILFIFGRVFPLDTRQDLEDFK